MGTRCEIIPWLPEDRDAVFFLDLVKNFGQRSGDVYDKQSHTLNLFFHSEYFRHLWLSISKYRFS